MPVVDLDARFVKTAVCPEGKRKIDFYDRQVTGFILEVRQSQAKTYHLRFRDRHKTLRQHKIGSAKDVSFEKAKKAAQTLRSQVVLGEDPAEERRAIRSVPTLKSFGEERFMPYLEGYRRRLDTDEGILRLHLYPQWGHRHLDEITHEEVVAFHKAKRASGLSAGYCNHMIVVLAHIYRLAAKWRIPGAEHNPAQGVQFFETVARDRYLTPEETHRLLEVLQENENTQLKYIIPLYILTGARRRELLDARWSDFDVGRRVWKIPMSKSGKPRHVPLSETVLQLLEQVPRFEECPYVVPNPKTRMPYRNFHMAWDRARKDAGMPELRLHDLRHSFASFLVNAGRSIYEISKILGHSKVTTTERYSHLSNQTLLDAADTAAAASGITVPS